MSNAQANVPLPLNAQVLDYSAGSAERRAIEKELQTRTDTPVEIPLAIGDKQTVGDDVLEITAPHAHTRRVAVCGRARTEDVERAIASAVAVQKEWSLTPWEERAAVFLKAADLLTERYRPAINATTMLGQGKTVHQAEIDAACELIDFLRYNVHYLQEIYAMQPRSAHGVWNRSEYRGLEGFVYAISPFNFTSLAINLATAPALMGCAVVWKPSEQATLSGWVGMEVLQEAGLPSGVINFVPGDPELVTECVLKHPEFAGLHFTGSTHVFRELWAKVGANVRGYRNYPRLVGETGGKDFVFVHSSADRQSVVNHLIRGAFEYQGQKCSAASRAYIPASVWSEVKDELLTRVAELKVGDPADFKNFMGAVISAKAYRKIMSYLEEAKGSAQVEVLVGGNGDDSEGYFIEPTILQAKDPMYRTMGEEIFGPVLTVYVYPDDELDATLATCDKTSPYALTGAIFAKDSRAVRKISTALYYAAGNLYINDKPTGAVIGQQPFGGSRASGTNDKAGSFLNLTRWMSARTVKENFLPLASYRYPYMDG